MGLLHGNTRRLGRQPNVRPAARLYSGAGRAGRGRAGSRLRRRQPLRRGTSRRSGGHAGGRARGSGCGQPATAGSVTYSLQSGGHTREVIVHVPASYSGKTKVPLVLNLHGSESTAQAQEVFSGMDATSDADGFIVAYPQALIPAAGGYEWNIPGVPLPGGQNAPANAANDVTFLTGLVRSLAAKYCVDTRQVYATGMSGGGRMASQLACDASQTFAAVAPVAGLRFPSSARPPGRCR